MRRVNTHVGMMNNFNRESFHRQIHKINSAAGDFTKCTEGIEMAEPEKPTFWRRFITLLDVDLLKDVIYLNILFGLSIFYVAEMNFKMVTPFFLASLGYNKSDTAAFLSVSALTDILARIIVPPICDRLNVSKRKIFMTALVFVAVTRSILAEQSGYTNLMVWLCICGFFRGIALSNFTLTVSEYSSLEKLPAAFGWHLIGKALFVIMFGPLIGEQKLLASYCASRL
jgi:MFS transporter, MCT family, solute carrier family 16 (monocarboxylic acid transporters), member 14